MAMMEALYRFEDVVIGGTVATAVLTTILSGRQGFGLSRLSLPFLVGTFFTANRARANVYDVAPVASYQSPHRVRGRRPGIMAAPGTSGLPRSQLRAPHA